MSAEILSKRLTFFSNKPHQFGKHWNVRKNPPAVVGMRRFLSFSYTCSYQWHGSRSSIIYCATFPSTQTQTTLEIASHCPVNERCKQVHHYLPSSISFIRQTLLMIAYTATANMAITHVTGKLSSM